MGTRSTSLRYTPSRNHLLTHMFPTLQPSTFTTNLTHQPLAHHSSSVFEELDWSKPKDFVDPSGQQVGFHWWWPSNKIAPQGPLRRMIISCHVVFKTWRNIARNFFCEKIGGLWSCQRGLSFGCFCVSYFRRKMRLHPWSLTVRPWTCTIPKGKYRLPTIIFNGLA